LTNKERKQNLFRDKIAGTQIKLLFDVSTSNKYLSSSQVCVLRISLSA